MFIWVVVALVAGAAGLAAKHDGVLKKGADTTYADTVAFEKQAAQNTLGYIEKLESRNEAKAEKRLRKNDEKNPPIQGQI